MARYGSVRRGSGGASLRVTFPDGAARASGALWRTCRAMSRNGAGRGLPRVFRYVPLDRLRRSRPPFQWNGCRVCYVGFALFRIGRDFFREPGRLPGAGARIRAGKGSVRAPDVPVPVTVYGLVQVARYGAVAVPHALSHCPAVKYGVSL